MKVCVEAGHWGLPVFRVFKLLGVLDGLGLTQQVDLDLAGVLQLVLDLLGDIAGQQDHLILADDLGLDHDADLAAGLDGEGLLNAVEGRGDLLASAA